VPAEATWWQRGTIYQVYPRSFQDSDGDGVGDLRGLASRLGHLASLGVDAVWLSPIFRSPMLDFGYDISDYRDVDPVFGTLEDLDRLVADAHALGMRVLLDFVPNHTSSLHPWFVEARQSRSSAHRDWYVWRDPAPGGGPPNDHNSAFGGSAWTWDEATGQYWYHSFLPEQPELDWRNPAVREAMLDHLRFWFDRGIDGFRIDVLPMIAKDAAPWLDGAISETGGGPQGAADVEGDPRYALGHGDGPEMDDRLAELHAVIADYPGRMLIGETYFPPARLVRYYGIEGRGIQLPFNVALITGAWSARAVRESLAAYETALPGYAWPNWVLGNHDQSRVVTRIGAAQARVATMLLLTLRGTPILYAGDEVGLPDAIVPPERIVDVDGRDPQRAPLPWTATGPHAGFTTGEPWLPMVEEGDRYCVERQLADPHSMLTLHRRLLALRREAPALHSGSWAAVEAPDPVVAFDRAAAGARFRVLLNLGSEAVDVPVDGAWRVALSTHLDLADGEAVAGPVTLRPDEGLLLREG
jgi:alpha-glucosidase